ncbi:MAG: hypothetical protein ACQEQF_11750 [Bacillota bacterium]
MNKNILKSERDKLLKASSYYIRNYAYERGDDIYKFMKKYNIGESNYGKIMDSAAKGKEVVAHRLYGHHPIYNFPIDAPEEAWQFVEHELSDLFTKQGLPIIPAELMENTPLLRYSDKLSNNWNFINGFDLLAGTISIYYSTKELKKFVNMEISIDSFEELAKHLGVAGIDLAIAMSTANPLLFVGATLQLVSGIKGIINEGAVVYFQKLHQELKVEFSLESLKIDKNIRDNMIDKSMSEVKVKNSVSNSKFNRFDL